MVIQIRAVGNQNNRRTSEILRTHQQTRQEQHGKAFTATSRTKIRTALAVAIGATHLADILEQGTSRIILRITAQDLLLLFAAVREILEVLENVQQAFAIEHPLNHGVKALDALGLDSLVAKFHAPPRIKVIVLGKETARPVVHAIANHAEGVIDKQLRNIAAVAHRQLLVRVENCRLFAHGTLELEHHKREPVHKKDCIGNALLGTDNFKLVYNLDDIAIGTVFRRHVGRQRHRLFIIIDTETRLSTLSQRPEIHKLNENVLILRVLALEHKTVRKPRTELLVALVKRTRRKIPQLQDNRTDFVLGNALGIVTTVQVVAQVLLNQDLALAAVNRLAGHVLAALLNQEVNKHFL